MQCKGEGEHDFAEKYTPLIYLKPWYLFYLSLFTFQKLDTKGDAYLEVLKSSLLNIYQAKNEIDGVSKILFNSPHLSIKEKKDSKDEEKEKVCNLFYADCHSGRGILFLSCHEKPGML